MNLKTSGILWLRLSATPLKTPMILKRAISRVQKLNTVLFWPPTVNTTV